MTANRSDSLSDYRTLVVLSGIIAATLGGVYWVLRLGFENPAGTVVKSVLLSVFVTVFPLAVRALLDRTISSPGSRSHWSVSYAFLWLGGLGVMGLIGRIVPDIGVNPFPALALLAVVSFAAILILWVREQGFLRSAAYVVGGLAFGAWTAGVVWGRVYKNPLFVESLIVDGKVHHDTLYLSSLGNMLRTYHVASVGIDGLNYVPYHWGSAWLFSQWANLVGIDVIHFYQLTFPVTIIPLFFGGVVALALFLRDRRQSSPELSARLGGRFWAVLIAIAVGIAPLSGLEAMGVWTSNILISESYTIAVPVALLFAAVAMSWADGVSSDVNMLHAAPLRLSDLLFLFVFLPAGIVLLGYLKISLLALAFAAAVFLFVRLSLYRRVAYAVSMAICAVAFYGTYKQVSLPAHHEGLVALDYLRSFVPPPWWVFFPLIHLLWTWVYAIYRCRRENIATIGELWSAIKERRVLDVELIVGVALLGVVPGLIIHIDGGSAFYFSDVQRWLAGACLLSWLAAVPAVVKRHTAHDQTSKSRIGGLSTRVLLFALLLLPVAGSVLSNATHWPAVMLQQNAAVRDEVYAAAGQPIGSRRMRDLLTLRDPATIARGLRASPNYTMVRALEQFQKLSPTARQRLALFIPQDDSHYWNSLKRPGACTFQSFVGPALSGLAMVDGMPAVGCQVTRYYGLGSFTPRARPQQFSDTTSAVLCERARPIGADTVVVMRFPGDSATLARVACARGAD